MLVQLDDTGPGDCPQPKRGLEPGDWGATFWRLTGAYFGVSVGPAFLRDTGFGLLGLWSSYGPSLTVLLRNLGPASHETQLHESAVFSPRQHEFLVSA